MQNSDTHQPNNRMFSGLASTTRAWVPGHNVQFYEDEAYLSSAVAAFLVEGARAGQPLIVIATAAHRNAFADEMRKLGVDPDDLVHARDAIWLDAEETLAAFMEGDRPNAELFEATVGNVFDRVIGNRKYAMVRAYGEMVDLLWRRANSRAAIALEEMWNALAKKYSFSLLCAYSKGSLMADPRAEGIEDICRCHAHVLQAAPGAKGN